MTRARHNQNSRWHLGRVSALTVWYLLFGGGLRIAGASIDIAMFRMGNTSDTSVSHSITSDQ